MACRHSKVLEPDKNQQLWFSAFVGLICIVASYWLIERREISKALEFGLIRKQIIAFLLQAFIAAKCQIQNFKKMKEKKPNFTLKLYLMTMQDQLWILFLYFENELNTAVMKIICANCEKSEQILKKPERNQPFWDNFPWFYKKSGKYQGNFRIFAHQKLPF